MVRRTTICGISAVRGILQMVGLYLANLDDSRLARITGQIIVSHEFDLEAVCYAAYGLCFLACLLCTVFDVGSPKRPMSFEQSTAEDYDIECTILRLLGLGLSLLNVLDLNVLVGARAVGLIVRCGKIHPGLVRGCLRYAKPLNRLKKY